MKTLIFGLGNPILRDDAVGMVVARAIHECLGDPDVDLVEASVAGLDLLDIISGYDKVVIIDCIKTASGKVGELHEVSPSDIPTTPRLTSPHDVDFAMALQLGEFLEQDMPEEIKVYAIEVADPYTFDEELSPEVAARVPEIVQTIADKEFPGHCERPDNQRRHD